MRPWHSVISGRIEERVIESPALSDNPLGDSASRPLWVYLPPSYDTTTQRFPCIYLLQGYAAALPKWNNRPAFELTVPERVDAVFSDPAVPPCVVVYVDAWTSLGGSQFINSPAIGEYHTYLCEDVIGFIDAGYRTLSDGPYRGLQGHSSGGFGAIVNAMLRPDLFGGFASHAGDTAYDLCYTKEIAVSYRALRDHYDRSYERFFSELKTRETGLRPWDFSLMMTYAMAACFSPNNDGTVELPFDTETGLLRPEVWQRWLAWDPVNMVADHAEALRSLRAIWIDCGRHDEYFFDVGAERFVHELCRVGVNDVALEIFDGGHSHIEHRYPLAMRYLAERLQREA